MGKDTCGTCCFQLCESASPLSQCCDLGYHSSLSRALRTYLSAELSLEASRRAGLEVLEGAVEGLDPARDRQRLLGLYPTAFCPPQRFGFQAHMGDAVSISTSSHSERGLTTQNSHMLRLFLQMF